MTRKTKAADTTSRTAAQIATEIAALDTAATERATALAELQAARPDLVEAGDVDAIEALDAQIRRAGIEGEVDKAKRARLVEAREAALLDEEQARRREIHAGGLEAAEEAAALRAQYLEAAQVVAGLLARMVVVRNVILEANKTLPEGVRPIADPERAMNVPPTKAVITKGKRRSSKSDGKGGFVECWQEYDWVSSPSQGEITMPPLAQMVRLPGVSHGDTAVWPAVLAN